MNTYLHFFCNFKYISINTVRTGDFFVTIFVVSACVLLNAAKKWYLRVYMFDMTNIVLKLEAPNFECSELCLTKKIFYWSKFFLIVRFSSTIRLRIHLLIRFHLVQTVSKNLIKYSAQRIRTSKF